MICQDIAREKSAGIIAGISASSTFQVEWAPHNFLNIFFDISNIDHVLVLPKAKLGKASYF